MYKLYEAPSSTAKINELADFVEVECIRNDQTSKRELLAALGRMEDTDYTDGVPIDDPLEDTLNDVYNELEKRKSNCNNSYPFHLDLQGHVVRTDEDTDLQSSYLYKYLLLSTRLDMKKHRVQGKLDGTLLFEEVSEVVAKEYLGNRAESYLFGTASGASFESKVNSLCRAMNEGRGFINRNQKSAAHIRDDSLDVVAWKPFTDNDMGKLIAFGQCKTGRNWKRDLESLNPDSFCRKWLQDSPTVLPIRLFFIAESLLRNEWYTTTTNAGIMFDRCRIMDYSNSIPTEVVEKIRTWTDAAISNHLN